MTRLRLRFIKPHSMNHIQEAAERFANKWMKDKYPMPDGPGLSEKIIASGWKISYSAGFQAGAAFALQEQEERIKELEQALKHIRDMVISCTNSDAEDRYTLAYNRCWTIADKALTKNRI